MVAKITSAIGIKPCGGCKKRQGALNRMFPFSYKGTSVPPFITTARLMEDAKMLASMLPPDISRIVGVARSGLCVATMVAMILHRPLSILRQSTYDIIDAGNGWRLSGNNGDKIPERVAMIDDTVMTGNSFKYGSSAVREKYKNLITAAVYVNPAAHTKPDVWVHDLPWPHLLEWNLFNSVLSPSCATDFDGVICHDCPGGSDDDGPRYAHFLENAQPRYLTRKIVVPLIVTARLEKYRDQTVSWLHKHGVAFDRLIMGPWQNNLERSRVDLGSFKAQHFSRFIKERHAIKPPVFIESDPGQAKRIAELSKGLVVCTNSGECYAG